MADTSKRSGKRTAFSITELLIVIGIIAVLISILIPSLGKARELCRRTKCMANQRTLAQAVQAFAVEHNGFGQLIVTLPMMGEPRTYRYLPDRYDYEKVGERGSTARPTLSSWPIAYADHIGAPGLRSEDLYWGWSGSMPQPGLSAIQVIQKDVQAQRKVGVLQCPADRELIGSVPGGTYAAISYSINVDLFRQGLADNLLDGFDPYGSIGTGRAHAIWRNGRMSGSALGGRLDRVVDPASVLMFVDGGGIESRVHPDSPPQPRSLSFRSSSDGPRFSDTVGSLLTVVPRHRHSPNGGLVGVCQASITRTGRRQLFRPGKRYY